MSHEDNLEKLADKLAGVFIGEADPANWPGADQLPKDRSKDDRGDRQWDIKNANQLGLLLARTLELRMRFKWQREAAAGADVPAEAGFDRGAIDPEQDIARLEREAQRAMENALGAASRKR